MSRPFGAIVSMVLLSTLAGNAMAAEAPPAGPVLADAVRGGWVTDIEGVRHIFILKVRDAVVSGVYCDVDCSDPAHLSVIERGSLTPDGVRFQIHRLDGRAPERTDVVGRIADNQLILTADPRARTATGASRWTLQRDPRKPAPVTLDELFARRGVRDGTLLISGSPNPYTPPGPNESLTAAAVEGLWVFSTGPAKQHFIFRRVGARILGVVCGPCDNPWTFGAIDNVAIHGDTLTFDINHEDWGFGIEFGPFENHATATVSRHEMHLHSVQRSGSRTIEGDLVLIGPLRAGSH